jgi:hypothetical protein
MQYVPRRHSSPNQVNSPLGNTSIHAEPNQYMARIHGTPNHHAARRISATPHATSDQIVARQTISDLGDRPTRSTTIHPSSPLQIKPRHTKPPLDIITLQIIPTRSSGQSNSTRFRSKHHSGARHSNSCRFTPWQHATTRRTTTPLGGTPQHNSTFLDGTPRQINPVHCSETPQGTSNQLTSWQHRISRQSSSILGNTPSQNTSRQLAPRQHIMSRHRTSPQLTPRRQVNPHHAISSLDDKSTRPTSFLDDTPMQAKPTHLIPRRQCTTSQFSSLLGGITVRYPSAHNRPRQIITLNFLATYHITTTHHTSWQHNKPMRFIPRRHTNSPHDISPLGGTTQHFSPDHFSATPQLMAGQYTS